MTCPLQSAAKSLGTPTRCSTFVSKTQQCLSLLSRASSLQHLLQIHAHILTSSLSLDPFLLSQLIRFSALSRPPHLSYALSLLSSSPHPPTIPSFNFLIRALSRSPHPSHALHLFVEMKQRATPKPNKLTFPFVLKACSHHPSHSQFGKQIHSEILKCGLHSDVYVQNTLIHLYGSCGEAENARQVFDEMPLRTIVSWNSIMSTFVENGLLEDCMLVFNRMRCCGAEPDTTTMVILLSACAEIGNLSLGRLVHSHVVVKGVAVNVQLGTALVDMYAKCGVVAHAVEMFDRMVERNVWSWSAMILGFAQHGRAVEALELFKKLKDSSVEPNYVTFLGVLCACSHAGLVEKGFKFFRDMSRMHSIEPRMSHYSCMVDILGRSGLLEEAYEFITRMPVAPDAVVWRTLLSACGFGHGRGSVIRENVKKRLLELEPRRSGNYVMVANMYADDGLWDKAANVRRIMRHDGLKKTAGESCVELGGVIYRFVSGDDSCIYCTEIYWALVVLNLHLKAVGYMNTPLVEHSTFD